MSDKLNEAREIINRADEQMAELFVQRMHAVEMVFEQHGVKLKKANWFDTLIEPFKQNKRR